MLSYRHAFHAGNFADVLKHSVLTLVLEYMTRKEKGFYYIDSHSGAGMYQLADEYAQKTGEYKDGIAKLIGNNDLPEALQPFIDLVKDLNRESDELALYPGSPGIARQFTRRQDSAHLFELHPTDIEHLKEYSQRWNKSHVKQSDGYQGVLGLVPPPNRRGVVLIDPPYELKEDYLKAVRTIVNAYKKFATGTYILWYPVVKRELVEQMQDAFTKSEVRNLLQVEYCQQADTDEYGMTGTGLFIVNPPWQLSSQLDEILPYLKANLGNSESQYSVKQLIAE
ncbi:23S rRNA (adenine(2030)-N(6))-methyltransferase RlmJ [Cognaticolwellia beringensis]|uniref:Ribosomal RNA large subunit methyltransferase J n=1 Tax=Cognaticolwellia beringensis TaxID=1967665 RepID=A0A222G644_9GAMM|nr:23S rRNA (adenine(2030)-N(6))-methyltransferase RlmJ [Cognaticolwellia beringensis]ASP47387.1 23S rRNA (adenine(2030)-N(6))-methyltransferase RlmJ [Cognaticolwellia beringensis]